MATVRHLLPDQLHCLDSIQWGGQALVVDLVSRAVPCSDGKRRHQVLALAGNGELVVALIEPGTPVPVVFLDPTDRTV